MFTNIIFCGAAFVGKTWVVCFYYLDGHHSRSTAIDLDKKNTAFFYREFPEIWRRLIFYTSKTLNYRFCLVKSQVSVNVSYSFQHGTGTDWTV